MKSQFAGIILFSLILVFVISFGHIGTGSCDPYGPKNLMLTTPTYYVATGGTNEPLSGTSTGDPWGSVSYAMTQLNSTNGYILYVAAGTYTDSFSVSSSGSSTTVTNRIIGDTSGGIIGSGGTVTFAPESANYVIEINGKSNISISGLTLSSSDYHGIYVHNDSVNITLNQISISSIGSAGDSAAIMVEGGDTIPNNISVTNCTISSGFDGIHVTDYCEGITIEDNTISGCENSGILIENYCDSGTIEDNTLDLTTCTNGIKINSNCETWNIIYNSVEVSDGTYGIYLNDVSNPILYNNMIDGSFSSAIIYDQDTENFSMNYNTCRNSSDVATVKGYHGYRSASTVSCYVYSFHNNILSLYTSNGHVMYVQGNEEYWLPDNANRISNNLYYNGAYCGFYDENNRSSLSDWQTILGTSYDNDSIRQNPVFISSSNVHIKATSPCFGAGIPISEIDYDIDNENRHEENPNIGADEFESITVANGEEVTIAWNQDDINATVDSGGTLNIDGTAGAIDVKFGTLTVNGDMSVSDEVVLKITGNFTIDASGSVYVGDTDTEIKAYNLSIISGGKLSANYAGYTASSGPGSGDDSATIGAGGAGYGGDGADGGTGVYGGSADDYTTDFLFYYPNLDQGSGGGNGQGTTGGAGGGVINLEVFNNLIVNGLITANGYNGGSDTSTGGATGSGGGAGGGIYIFAKNLSGTTGTICADGGNGGDGYNNTNGGGAGAGGRIAIYFKTSSFSSNYVTTDAGTSGTGCSNTAEDGTEEILELPDFCKKKICRDSNAAVVPGPTGNESINLIDLSLVTQYQISHLSFNSPLDRNFELYYGSTNAITDGSSPIGSANWTHSFNEKLVIDGNVITYMLLCGAVVVYEQVSTNVFEALPFYGQMPNIVYDGSSKYTITYKDGKVKEFDNGGNWLSYSDSAGYKMTLTYDQISGYLDYVTYSDGRVLRISYISGYAPKIDHVTSYETTSMSQAIATSTTFTYTGNDLTDIGEWEFTYSNDFINQQKHEYSTGLYVVTSYTIDSSTGECSVITDNSNQTVNYNRSEIDNHTVVNDRSGIDWIFEWDKLMNVIVRKESPLGSEWNYRYDSERFMIKYIPPQHTEQATPISYKIEQEEVISRKHIEPEEAQDEQAYSYKQKLNMAAELLSIDPSSPNGDFFIEYVKTASGKISTEIIRSSADPDNNYIYSHYEYDDADNMIEEYGPVANEDNINSGNLAISKVTYEYNINLFYSSNTIYSINTKVYGNSTSFNSEFEIGDTITANGETRTVKNIVSNTELDIDSGFIADIPAVNPVLYIVNFEYYKLHKVRQITRRLNSNDNFVIRFYYDENRDLTKRVVNYGGAIERETEYEYVAISTSPITPITKYVSNIKVYNSITSGYLVTNYEYYSSGSVKQVTEPTGLITQYVYDGNYINLLRTCTDPGGEQVGTEYSYDGMGRTTQIRSGKWSSWSYSSASLDTTTSAYSQKNYLYVKDAATNIDYEAVYDPLNHGYVVEFDGDKTSVVQKGYVLTGGSHPSIDKTKAYSETKYEYNGDGKLETTKKLVDSVYSVYAEETTEYNDQGNVSRVIGPKYDNYNNMEEIYEYDFAGRVIASGQKINNVGDFNEVSRTYNAFGRVLQTVVEEGTTTSYVYNDYTGAVDTVHVDPANNDLQTSYVYDVFGQTTREIYAAQSAAENIYRYTEYDSDGRIIKEHLGPNSSTVFSAGANATEYDYDSYGRLYKKTKHNIDDNTTSVDVEYIFDSLNRTKAICHDPTGTVKAGVVYTYDALGRVIQVDQVEFTTFNRTATPQYTFGTPLRTTQTVYDIAGRVVKTIVNPTLSNPSPAYENITTEYVYDELGQVIKVYNPEQYGTSNYTQYDYDNLGRLTKVEAHGAATQTLAEFTYFENGSRCSMIYYQNTSPITVGYSYYPTGALESVSYPGYNNDPDVYSYEYFKNGAIKKVTHGDVGELFEYQYDTAGRISTVEDKRLSKDRHYFYNDRSQVTSIQDESFVTIYTINYDTLGRVSSTVDSTPGIFSTPDDTVSYEYYKSGLRSQMETPYYTISYDYDNAGRLKEIKREDPNTSIFYTLATYAYNSLGQRTTYTRYNTSTSDVALHTEYDYLDGVGWLTKVTNLDDDTGGTTLSRYQYYETNEGDKHDALGNRLYLEGYDGTNTYKYEYVYDDMSRLTSETRSSGGNQVAKYEYTYDNAGNRVDQKRYTTSPTSWVNHIVYGYNSANQLISEDVSDQSYLRKDIDYIYDDLGNLVQKNVGLFDYNPDVAYTESWEYDYDCYNRLIDVDRNGQNVANYTFNALGNRVQKYVNATSETINMLYDRGDCVADYDDNDNLLRYYITPFMDENMVLTDASSGTPSMDLFYAQDGLGTVRQIFNATSSLVNNYDYEGFGTETSTTGSLYNRYRYTGREYDAETEWDVSVGTMNYSFNGTYYYRARTYDSTIGSFTSRDPIPASNLYPYCAANPINFTDPTGTVAYKNCQKCAQDFLDCIYDKIKNAVDKALQDVTNLITVLNNTDSASGLRNYFDTLYGALEGRYSIFDIDPTTRYNANGFNHEDSFHRENLDIIQSHLTDLHTTLTGTNTFSVVCKSSSIMSNNGEWDPKTKELNLNMGLLCNKKHLEPGQIDLADDFVNSVFEGATTIIFMHELTHAAYTSSDDLTIFQVNPDKEKRAEKPYVISDYYTLFHMSAVDYWQKANYYTRVDHSDSFTAFLMHYYDKKPECILNSECCSLMKEPER